MKKRVAIVTLNHGVNYGNKLQNYAVQEVFKKLNCKPITIQYYPEDAKVKNDLKLSTRVLIKKIKKKINNKMYAKNIKKRIERFNNFNRDYLIRSDNCYTPYNYETIDESEYDYFSVGSDQVWNSYFFDFSPIYLLGFVKEDYKKIAYAASFGVDDVAQEYRAQFTECLSKFKAISVREDKAREIVESISTNTAQVVIDPTLMLSQKEWNDFSSNMKTEKEKGYVFVYFLGEITHKRRKMITEYAKKKELEIVEVNRLENKYYVCGPVEFVFFIKNADMVFTDSFHACCLSLQFEKKFWVMNRVSTGKEMGSRIDTFLSKFCLENRRYIEAVDVDQDISYEKSRKILEYEREISWSFLRRALGE